MISEALQSLDAWLAQADEVWPQGPPTCDFSSSQMFIRHRSR